MAVAALDHFIADGTITPDQTTVVVLTGSGLKSADKMATPFRPEPSCRSPHHTTGEGEAEG